MSVFQAGDVVDTRPARRLADTIGTVKQVLLGLVAVATGVAVIAGLASGVSGLTVVGFGLVYGLISGISIYVTFGWLEHTLRLLVGIAHNTADVAEFQPGSGE